MAAESVVQFVVEKLGDALIKEIILLKGVRQQFERLQRELVSITGFLKTADARHSNDPDIRIWVSDVRDIAYDVDDVIDAFFLKFVWKEKECSLLRRGVSRARKIIDAHHMGKEIQAIFSRIDDISERRKRYHITDTFERGETSASTANHEVRLRRSYAHATDEDVVGLEEEIHILVGQLVKEEERRRVITICGMGGLGKTTLAKKVYHHKDVRNNFDCQAWTFISQECKLNDVLRDILRQVGAFSNREQGEMTEVDIVEKLSAVLKENRYLVVLDDIWHVEHWDMLKAAFPSGKSGSKVVLTTRNKAIGEHADPWALHVEPRLLTADEAWDLICRKVFPGDIFGTSWSMSSDLEKCGREMASKCSGLPLAIIVLSGILATKNSLMEWETVSLEMTAYMNKGQSGVLSILALSYTDLPYHLKPFFLFMGLFPEDHHISVKKLIRMWVAESMISEIQGDYENVGRRHLDELVHRCMVQVVKRDSQGRVGKCQLHDKMRDLSIAKGGEENFFEIVGRPTGSSNYLAMDAISRKLRRCVINLEGERYVPKFREENIFEIVGSPAGSSDHLGGERYVFPKHLIPHLRTVFFVGAGRSSLNIKYQDFKLVKVLCLQGVRLDIGRRQLEFCEIIGKLTNLRYLGLRGTFLECLPESIGNLVSLQTIDVRGASYIHLPNVIWKMRQLRHLYLPESSKNSSLMRLDTLTKLQTLSVIISGPWIADLVKLTNLNKLAISNLTTRQLERVIDIVSVGLDNLVTLSLDMQSSCRFSNLHQLFQKSSIRYLSLDGKMWSIPSNWPPNITKLMLYGSVLLQDPMPTLQMLQNLAHLVLWNAYTGIEMVCSENGFPQLRYLEIRYLSHLEEWRVEKGAMPCLTTCEICNCDSLKMVPQGFQFVTTLQSLLLLGLKMSRRFKERVEEGGEDWDTARNIPSIIVKI